MHLKSPGCLERVAVMANRRFALACGPTDDQNIESNGDVLQSSPLQKSQGSIRQTALFGLIDRARD